MRKFLSITLLLLVANFAIAQNLTVPPSGDNQKSSVTQYIGLVKVNINYSSPNVHAPDGTDRTEHIWGELVPYGVNNLGFGTATAAPLRAGANENTIIYFSHDVKINGKDLKAGTYGLHLIVEKDKPWTWVFSKNSSSWGSYFYDQKEDALRVEANAADAPFVEYLTYGFDERKPSSAVAFLHWENKKVGFKIEVPNINELYIATMRDELRGAAGFDYQNWMAAANFCVQHNINLDEALTWADAAISAPFVGQENFNSLQTKANVLYAMKKNTEANAVMDVAIKHPTANVGAIHQYGRSLLAKGENQKALEVFKYNQKQHPEDKFTPNVGLARGYAAVGDKKNAIKYWELAIKNLPENQKGNLAYYEGEVKKLKG